VELDRAVIPGTDLDLRRVEALVAVEPIQEEAVRVALSNAWPISSAGPRSPRPNPAVRAATKPKAKPANSQRPRSINPDARPR